MFQQEVAERICAEPGTPAYGRLSVLAQWTCEVELLLRIAACGFRAAAEGVFRGGGPHAACGAAGTGAVRGMERLTAAAFGQRRKMLRGAH